MERKIRELKIKTSHNRREISSTLDQPAQKKRKLSKEEYKRVLHEKKIAKKRENTEIIETEDKKHYKIFNQYKKKKLDRKETEGQNYSVPQETSEFMVS